MIRKKAIHFFVRYNKYPPTILKHMIGEGDCFVESTLWGDDSHSLLLRISKGQTGEPIWIYDWRCVYDLTSGTISTDLRALNRGAVLPGKYHHQEEPWRSFGELNRRELRERRNRRNRLPLLPFPALRSLRFLLFHSAGKLLLNRQPASQEGGMRASSFAIFAAFCKNFGALNRRERRERRYWLSSRGVCESYFRFDDQRLRTAAPQILEVLRLRSAPLSE